MVTEASSVELVAFFCCRVLPGLPDDVDGRRWRPGPSCRAQRSALWLLSGVTPPVAEEKKPTSGRYVGERDTGRFGLAGVLHREAVGHVTLSINHRRGSRA